MQRALLLVASVALVGLLAFAAFAAFVFGGRRGFRRLLLDAGNVGCGRYGRGRRESPLDRGDSGSCGCGRRLLLLRDRGLLELRRSASPILVAPPSNLHAHGERGR